MLRSRSTGIAVRDPRRGAGSRNNVGATVAQIAIAWVAAQGEGIVPLVGVRRRDRLEESLGALGVALTADDLQAIERGAEGCRRRRSLRRTVDGAPGQRTHA